MRSWTLRSQLVLAVSVVAIGAIAVFGLVTLGVMRESLTERLDRQVRDVSAMVAPDPRGNGEPPDRARTIPSGTWRGVYHLDRDGEYELIVEHVAGVSTDAIESSDRPAIEVDDELVEELLDDPATIDAVGGDGSFRVMTRNLRRDDVLVTAVPTDFVDDTLDRLLAVEVAVGSLAALVVVLASWVVVRARLRTLDAIADSADHVEHDVEAGRLQQRVVTNAAPGTEVGRLAAAINGMLDRIDSSVAAQQRTQDRFRSFVADAAHELRTPLTSIRGFAELARTRVAEMDDAERERSLRNVEEEADHLAALVEDLLLLSRLDEGMPLSPRRCDVREIAQTAVEAARAVEPGRSIQLAGEVAVERDVDPMRVRQLFDNLLANVRAHAGADAAVTVAVEPAGVDAVQVSVTDTGRGLEGDALEHATDRFWRADAARSRSTAGAGLGLSIVRAIAQAHGGDVELAPGPGGSGLRVTATLHDR